ncbi:MAG: HlyC/CorC family transporter [Kiritimatiellae bacterium]|nr:HlyC/CorC family transporter [Kiritimatiellia bacterium]
MITGIVSAQLIAFAALMCCSAFFSSAETIFFSMSPLTVRRLGQRSPSAGTRIRGILAYPTRLLATILIGNTIVNVAIAVLGFSLAERLAPQRGEAISIPVVTVLLVIFGEAGPKRVGLLLAEPLAILYAPLVIAVTRILAPLRALLEQLTKRLERFFRPRGRTLSEEEFETVLEISSEEGILNADELALIKAIIRLEDMRASDVMTPRVDIIGLEAAEDPAAVLARARASRRGYLPIYRDQLDNIEGFLDVRKFLLDPEHRIENAHLPPFFVPENSPLSRLLIQFQREHRRIAVVVDEYGGTAGVITRGDMLEEITGEIYNELNKPRPLFQPAGPHRWLVDANIRIEELNRKLRLHLEAEGAERIAGWIGAHAGHVARQGDVVEAQGCRVTVLQTLKQRVTLVQIEKLEVPE